MRSMIEGMNQSAHSMMALQALHMQHATCKVPVLTFTGTFTSISAQWANRIFSFGDLTATPGPQRLSWSQNANTDIISLHEVYEKSPVPNISVDTLAIPALGPTSSES